MTASQNVARALIVSASVIGATVAGSMTFIAAIVSGAAICRHSMRRGSPLSATSNVARGDSVSTKLDSCALLSPGQAEESRATMGMHATGDLQGGFCRVSTPSGKDR